MAKYRVTFTPIAKKTYNSMPAEAQQALDVKTRRMKRNPQAEGYRNPSSGVYEGTFGNGYGVVHFDITTNSVTVTLLRIQWAG